MNIDQNRSFEGHAKYSKYIIFYFSKILNILFFKFFPPFTCINMIIFICSLFVWVNKFQKWENYFKRLKYFLLFSTGKFKSIFFSLFFIFRSLCYQKLYNFFLNIKFYCHKLFKLLFPYWDFYRVMQCN